MKCADHRRLLSRWAKALFRYVGLQPASFARREVRLAPTTPIALRVALTPTAVARSAAGLLPQ